MTPYHSDYVVLKFSCEPTYTMQFGGSHVKTTVVIVDDAQTFLQTISGFFYKRWILGEVKYM